jgi:cytidine deaminase
LTETSQGDITPAGIGYRDLPKEIEPASSKIWASLEDKAWEVREKAHIYNKTKVGAALLDKRDHVYGGCNVEQRFRSHDIHAEVNAIGSMVAEGGQTLVAILVVSDKTLFTPCGACMDWILQFGGDRCLVGYQSAKGAGIAVYEARELMPFYPRS